MRASLLQRIRFSYTLALVDAAFASARRKLSRTTAAASRPRSAMQPPKLDGKPACTARTA